jgi:MFS superfamily sulfate permease-like transporter
MCGLWFDRYLSSQEYISHLPTLGDKYGAMHASLWAPPSLSSPALTRMAESPKDVGLASFSIAFVAVLESLISGKLADAMTHSEMDTRREVLGLSISNLLCGVAGGLPATAALARTALSIRSGATSRVAGVMSATLTGLLASCLLPVFAYLPLCVVAALLFQVATGMMESQHLRDAYNLDNNAFRLTVVVVILCLVFDPTVAIVVGAILGLITQAAQVARGYSEVITNSDLECEDISLDIGRRRPSIDQYLSLDHSLTGGQASAENRDSGCEPHNSLALYRIVGDLDYLSALTHTQRLRQLRQCHYIIISFRFCHYIDLDGLHQLKESITDLCQRGQNILLCGIPSFLQPILCKSEWYLKMQKDGRVRPKLKMRWRP